RRLALRSAPVKFGDDSRSAGCLSSSMVGCGALSAAARSTFPVRAAGTVPMIDRIVAFSIRNRLAVIAAALLFAAWGVYSLYNTPMDAVPDLSENQVIVFTEWMGHSPREVED